MEDLNDRMMELFEKEQVEWSNKNPIIANNSQDNLTLWNPSMEDTSDFDSDGEFLESGPRILAKGSSEDKLSTQISTLDNKSPKHTSVDNLSTKDSCLEQLSIERNKLNSEMYKLSFSLEGISDYEDDEEFLEKSSMKCSSEDKLSTNISTLDNESPKHTSVDNPSITDSYLERLSIERDEAHCEIYKLSTRNSFPATYSPQPSLLDTSSVEILAEILSTLRNYNAKERLMKGLSGEKMCTKNSTLDSDNRKQSSLGNSSKKDSPPDKLSTKSSTPDNDAQEQLMKGFSGENMSINLDSDILKQSSSDNSSEKDSSLEKLSTESSTLDNDAQEQLMKGFSGEKMCINLDSDILKQSSTAISSKKDSSLDEVSTKNPMLRYNKFQRGLPAEKLSAIDSMLDKYSLKQSSVDILSAKNLENESPKQAPVGKSSKKKVSFVDQLTTKNSTLDNNSLKYSSLGKSSKKKVSFVDQSFTKNSTLDNNPPKRLWKSLPFILNKPKYSPANRRTRNLTHEFNYKCDIFTDDSSMHNNVDTIENPLENLPKKEPKGSVVLKKTASPMKNSQHDYQNFAVFAKKFSQNNFARNNSTMDKNLSSKEPQGIKIPNDSSQTLENSSQKMPKISILKRTSNKSNLPKDQNLDMENNSSKKGSLLENFTDLNQAEIEALKSECMKNNSTRNAKNCKNNSYNPLKAPTVNISIFQTFQPSQNEILDFVENYSTPIWKFCPTTTTSKNPLPELQEEIKNPIPEIHEEKKPMFKCYVCQAIFGENSYRKKYDAGNFNEKQQFQCNRCWGRAKIFIGDTPAPLLDTPSPLLDTPAPLSDTPAPLLDIPAPLLDTVAPLLDFPTPLLDTPVPLLDISILHLDTPESLLATPESLLDTPAPLLDTAAPLMDFLTPLLDTPVHILDFPAPLLDTPESLLDTPAPQLDTPAPLLDTPVLNLAPNLPPTPALLIHRVPDRFCDIRRRGD